MGPVLAVVPLHWRRKESDALINSSETAKVLGITVEHRTISAWYLDTDAVVAIAIRGVEVEDEDKPCSLKNDYLVTLMLERDVSLRGSQPSILGLRLVHGPIEVVQELVSKEVIFG